MKPLLEIASPELFQSLKKNARLKTFNANQEIFAQSEPALFLPIILSGEVKMVRYLNAGKEIILSVFGDGEMFAVPPAFDGAPYPATAVAMVKTKLLLLYRDDFLRRLRESSEFSFAIISWMCEMLREKSSTIQNLATSSPEYRVAHTLLRLAEKTHSDDAKINLRRRDIAEMAGLTTETTIRVVRKLAEKNLIEIRQGKIILETPEILRDYLK
jgi:CRP-like cAMP-binding protein